MENFYLGPVYISPAWLKSHKHCFETRWKIWCRLNTALDIITRICFRFHFRCYCCYFKVSDKFIVYNKTNSTSHYHRRRLRRRRRWLSLCLRNSTNINAKISICKWMIKRLLSFCVVSVCCHFLFFSIMWMLLSSIMLYTLHIYDEFRFQSIRRENKVMPGHTSLAQRIIIQLIWVFLGIAI